MHSISLYIVETEEILDFPHVISNNGLALIPVTNKLIKVASNGQIVLTHDDFRETVENYLLGISCHPDIVFAETDYFGGAGDQSAKLINDETTVYERINDALSQMGVEKSDGLDEFDTVGLGNYRTNEEIVEKWESKVGGKTVVSTYVTYLLRDVPKEIELDIYEERQYITPNKYISQIGPVKRLVHETIKKSTGTCSHGPIKIINKNAEYGPEQNDLRSDTPYSILNIEYAVDGGGYTFMRVTSKNSRNGSTLVLVQVNCDEAGNHVMHKQVEDQIICPFYADIHVIGLTGNTPAKPKPVKKVVYECPCGKDMKVENNQLLCECGQKYEYEGK